MKELQGGYHKQRDISMTGQLQYLQGGRRKGGIGRSSAISKSQQIVFPKQEIAVMGAENLNIALKYFVIEARKQDGTFYPSHTLHALYSTIHGYLRAENIRMDLLGGGEFIEAKAALDAVMKERSAIGLGACSRKSTEVITDEEENMLWEKRILGDDTPQQLLDTILYLTGLHFSLRGGIEHRNLRLFRNPQITGPTEDANGRSYLLYKEDTSKNNSGGLRERKNKPKEVRAYDNPTDPSRCYVRLFQKYRNACEPIAGKTDAFYFQPLKKIKKNQWFSSVPFGHNTLQGTVKRMCEMGGIAGRKTNRSLRATSATRLYQKNVEEQLICEQTGHRSEAVRTYKRSSDDQKALVSDILYAKKPKSASTKSSTSVTMVTKTDPEPGQSVDKACSQAQKSTDSHKTFNVTLNFK